MKVELPLSHVTGRATNIMGDIGGIAATTGFSDVPGIDKIHRALRDRQR